MWVEGEVDKEHQQKDEEMLSLGWRGEEVLVYPQKMG